LVELHNVMDTFKTVFRYRGIRGIFTAISCTWDWFTMWFFTWMLDEDGDIALVIARRLAFVKYKQSTLIRFGNFSRWREAPKYLSVRLPGCE